MLLYVYPSSTVKIQFQGIQATLTRSSHRIREQKKVFDSTHSDAQSSDKELQCVSRAGAASECCEWDFRYVKPALLEAKTESTIPNICLL